MEQVLLKQEIKMTTNIQQGTLLDVLKKKMRQTKEEMEKYKDECEEFQNRLQGEVIRREEVSANSIIYTIFTYFAPNIRETYYTEETITGM